MFFVDKPYVSEFFKKTVRDYAIPVVGTEAAKQAGLYPGTKLISEDQAVERVRESENPVIYTLSENSIHWISEHLHFTDLPEKIDLFKNKLKFRELTKSFFPEFYFKEIPADSLKTIQIDDVPLPFIIKPTVGFFSMGVHKVSSRKDWDGTREALLAEMGQINALYPEEVLDTRSFILEQVIHGEEFAMDAYYDSAGKPVILTILKHIFASDADVGDRVYITSKDIIEDNLGPFTEFLEKMGDAAGVKNFPVHVELRRDADGMLLPIEVNPMRFGGWCTTADLSFLAYGFNPYVYYYFQKKPNWSEVLKGKEGKLFSIIVLNNSTGRDVNEIQSFDYEKLLSYFEKPLELRKIDYRKHSVFGFLFAETREANFGELERLLTSDLTEFVRM
ncbi:MAG: ATP-grasp domain-containing protein [Calditrichaeota bacterium]|nr:ATP-grasp domain-containing protein [Calditrichota bacterium]